jgi:hypothetical protein
MVSSVLPDFVYYVENTVELLDLDGYSQVWKLLWQVSSNLYFIKSSDLLMCKIQYLDNYDRKVDIQKLRYVRIFENYTGPALH